jgi:hypothetical protein
MQKKTKEVFMDAETIKHGLPNSIAQNPKIREASKRPRTPWGSKVHEAIETYRDIEADKKQAKVNRARNKAQKKA